MALPESVLNQPASSKFAIWIAGGESLFLADVCVGQRIYMGSHEYMSGREFRHLAASLDYDVRTLTVGELFNKHGLCG